MRASKKCFVRFLVDTEERRRAHYRQSLCRTCKSKRLLIHNVRFIQVIAMPQAE
jgi:hypothetical protein